jgi:hypothetical protein
MNKGNVAKILIEQTLKAGHSERLIPDSFEENDPYKVCYRFLANLTQLWVDQKLECFPTEEDAIEIAREAHPYFIWLFSEEDGLDQFKRLYEFHADLWR